ncbi:hypothetical protein N866_03240 [Actinotalea ferrariae CF5-4]|uniref:Uncharacterized protein n=1 Tax=Actinotalea ferrariae CF5-4 TaxID=948458 RepID=A0A021VUQ4_9CELL|nr:hypothetical protein [Actinotalea ferrariae]EYR64871.1 hypothetical protein N866_03240 [Actinotalea ferrariae CF5-4]
MTENAPPGPSPDPPRRELRGRATARPANDRGAARRETINTITAVANTVLLALQLTFGVSGPEPPPPPPPTVVTHVTVPVTVLVGCAPTVTGEGGPAPTVHPPSAPEGPDHQENAMSIRPGQHVTAEFSRNDVVEVIVLQVRGREALVQQKGTERAEWIPLSDLR